MMEKLDPIEPPPGWGTDELSNFLEISQRNTYATFHILRPPYEKLAGIDRLYRKVIDNLSHSASWFAALFVLRSHSSYLAAARMALSGQVPETYLLLRGCLENAIYGFYIDRHPELRETWLRRHDDAEAMKLVRKEFQIGPILSSVEAAHSNTGAIARTLYDRTIDYGAHPNERALSQVLGMNRGEGEVRFEVRYLMKGKDVAFGLALKTCAQVGVCGLDLFYLVYPQRFDILAITDDLQQLKRDL